MRPAQSPAREWLAWAAALALILFQAWEFWSPLRLSLGPRAVLQPWLMARGYVLYEQATDLHTPLMALTLGALASLTPDMLLLAKAVKVGLLAATTLLTFLAARRYAGARLGLGAAAYLALWAPDYYPKLWHESFLAPLYLLLALAYDPAAREHTRGRLLLTGLIGGAALLAKQHAVVVLGVVAAWHLTAGRLRGRPLGALARDLIWIAGGAALPILAVLLYQWLSAGTLEGFFYWTVRYSLTSQYKDLALNEPDAGDLQEVGTSWLLLPAALLVLVDCIRRRRTEGERGARLGWTLAATAAASATLYPYWAPFHLQAAFPLAALASAQAAAIGLGGGVWRRRLTAAALAAAVWVWLAGALPLHAPVLKRDAPREISQYSDLGPFARRIREVIGPEACIYLLPEVEANSNLYYHLGCEPPRYWVFHYSWYMAEARIRSPAFAALQEAAPEWVVYFPEWWHTEQYAPEIVAYVTTNYRYETDVQWDWRSAQLWRRIP